MGLHLVEGLVDIHEALQESWPRLDEVAGQCSPSAIVHLKPDVALPEGEDFPDEVVLEELHTGEYVEHGGLLHPFAQG